MALEKLGLSGQRAIITGGGTGLGRAMALALASAGADVAVSGRRPAPLQEVAGQVEARGRRSLALPADITDPAQVDAMVAAVMREWGGVDILINNAGIVREWTPKPLWETTNDEWRVGIDTNLSGAFYCSRAVSHQMAEQGKGCIINMASGFGLRGQRENYMYCAAKGGVINLTRSLAMSLSGYGIRVNCIAPGFFATIPEVQDYSYSGQFIPIGRVGDPDEIGGLAVYLSSDAAAYVTGEVFLADGGALAGGYAPTGSAPLLPLGERP
jgi:NAD(P)-dependent dehydrogenase (short-subunit alcohol dehydrogenase family)